MDRTVRNAEIRTCAGCRQKEGRDALLRLVVSGDPPRVVPDVRGCAPGRGVSVHPRRRCVQQMLRGNRVQRAFRRGVISPSVDNIVTEALNQYCRRIEQLLLAARRNRRIAVARDAVDKAIGGHSVELIIEAVDASERHQPSSNAIARRGIRSVVFGSEESYGRLFGRGAVGVLAILDRGIAESIVDAIERCAKLAEDS